MKETTEISIQTKWLKTLLKYANKTNKLSKTKNIKDNLDIALPGLLGYIDSAKHILKLK